MHGLSHYGISYDFGDRTITDAGKTVIQNATNVVSGDSVITVTPTTENGVKTYTITASVNPDGAIAEGNTGNINTKEQFLWCANRSEFATIKADMRLTSDGKVILCHDAGVTLDQAGDIISYDSENMTPIHDLTYDQCLALKFASTGYHMCGLETVIKICKMYGKLLFITIRNEYVDDTLDVLFDLLDKHNFRDYTIINNYVANLTTLGKVRAIDPNILVSYTSANVNFITTELVDIVEGIGNAIFCGTGFGSQTQSVDDVLSGKETAIAYATSKGIPVYAATVYDGSFIDGMLDYGLSGCQIGVVPEFD